MVDTMSKRKKEPKKMRGRVISRQKIAIVGYNGLFDLVIRLSADGFIFFTEMPELNVADKITKMGMYPLRTLREVI
jgi:hypothetical protein